MRPERRRMRRPVGTMKTAIPPINLLRSGAAALAIAGAVCVCAQTAQPPALQNFDNVQIRAVPVQRNVYLLSGAGGNITVQIGTDGVLLVDTEFAPLASKILAEVRKLTPGYVRYIINTHVHGDHVGGNDALAGLIPSSNQEPLSILPPANVLNRLTAPGVAKATGGTF